MKIVTQAYPNKILRERDLTFVEPARTGLNDYLDRWLTAAAAPVCAPGASKTTGTCSNCTYDRAWTQPLPAIIPLREF